MATIEELREREQEHLKTGSPYLPTYFYIHYDIHAQTPPDSVVIRLATPQGKDVFWMTADGELHFGPQALAGLVQAVFAQMAQHKLVMTGRHVEGLIESMVRKELDRRSVSPVASGNCPPDDNNATQPAENYAAGAGIYKFHMTAEQTAGDRVTMNPDEYHWKVIHSGGVDERFLHEAEARSFARHVKGKLYNRRNTSGIRDEDFSNESPKEKEIVIPVPSDEELLNLVRNKSEPMDRQRYEELMKRTTVTLPDKSVRNPFEKQPPLE